MLFKEREIKRIAGATDTNDKTVIRILGGVKVKITSPADSNPDVDILEQLKNKPPKTLELGFRLQDKRILSEQKREQSIEMIIKALREYRSKCSLVVLWVGRGDFDPKVIPQNITRGALLHACRTAGRLRAKILRDLTS